MASDGVPELNEIASKVQFSGQTERNVFFIRWFRGYDENEDEDAIRLLHPFPTLCLCSNVFCGSLHRFKRRYVWWEPPTIIKLHTPYAVRRHSFLWIRTVNGRRWCGFYISPQNEGKLEFSSHKNHQNQCWENRTSNNRPFIGEPMESRVVITSKTYEKRQTTDAQSTVNTASAYEFTS